MFNSSSKIKKAKIAVETGIIFENIFALVIPRIFIEYVKKIKASEEPKTAR